MADFNLLPMKEILFRAARSAFSQIRANHNGEIFYCIGIFTDGVFSYLRPTAMTEQGLDDAVRKYRKIPRYQNENTESLRFSLRWSPCDSPLHIEGEEYFLELDDTMGDISSVLCSIDFDHGWGEFEEFVANIRNAICDVIVALDREGVFGKGEDREKVFVTMLMGDQDNSILEIGRRLNPTSTVEWFEKEWQRWGEFRKSR